MWSLVTSRRPLGTKTPPRKPPQLHHRPPRRSEARMPTHVHGPDAREEDKSGDAKRRRKMKRAATSAAGAFQLFCPHRPAPQGLQKVETVRPATRYGAFERHGLGDVVVTTATSRTTEMNRKVGRLHALSPRLPPTQQGRPLCRFSLLFRNYDEDGNDAKGTKYLHRSCEQMAGRGNNDTHPEHLHQQQAKEEARLRD